MIDLRAQTFGVEIEMTGITRNRAAKTIAAYFGTEASHYGGGYDVILSISLYTFSSRIFELCNIL